MTDEIVNAETVTDADEIVSVGTVTDPNEIVRFVCIDGLIRKATAEELASILEFEQISLRDTAATLAYFSRAQRNKLLADSDWVELPTAIARLTGEQYSSWMTYRQALRDVPAQEGFPNTITWPIQPA